MTLENVVGRYLQTDRLGLSKTVEQCEEYILKNKKEIPDLHTLPSECLLKLVLR